MHTVDMAKSTPLTEIQNKHLLDKNDRKSISE